MVSKMSSTRFGARPIDGSSSMSSLGLAISPLAVASICCSPPESVPPFWVRRSFRRGNSSNTQSMALVDSRGILVPEEGAHLEVLLDGHPREDPATFGNLDDALGGHLVDLESRDLLAEQLDRARARGEKARDRLERRRLAGTVRADERHDLAFVDVDGDALEGLDLPVEGVDVVDP